MRTSILSILGVSLVATTSLAGPLGGGTTGSKPGSASPGTNSPNAANLASAKPASVSDNALSVGEMSAIDPTGIIKPLSKIRVSNKKLGYQCTTTWQNISYTVSALWNAYQIACKAGLSKAYTTLATANPPLGTALLISCNETIMETTAKALQKVAGPKTFSFVEGKGFTGKTRWFTDRGWFSSDVLKDDELYVTVGRERTPSQIKRNKLATATVNVCTVDMVGKAQLPNGDWEVNADSCACERVTFDSKSPVDDSGKLVDQVIVPMKKTKGKLLHVYIDGRKGTFKYNVSIATKPADAPAVKTPTDASVTTAPANIPPTIEPSR